MSEQSVIALINRKYVQSYDAQFISAYPRYLTDCEEHPFAALGYHRADEGALFAEHYLDEPIEAIVSHSFGYHVEREQIVEIGNLASDNALSTVALWGLAANDLGSSHEIAVATLTRSLRSMFARIGIDLKVLARAEPARVPCASQWGRYYDSDPYVCAGKILDGQQAITAFLNRRRGSIAA